MSPQYEAFRFQWDTWLAVRSYSSHNQIRRALGKVDCVRSNFCLIALTDTLPFGNPAFLGLHHSDKTFVALCSCTLHDLADFPVEKRAVRAAMLIKLHNYC